MPKQTKLQPTSPSRRKSAEVADIRTQVRRKFDDVTEDLGAQLWLAIARYRCGSEMRELFAEMNALIKKSAGEKVSRTFAGKLVSLTDAIQRAKGRRGRERLLSDLIGLHAPTGDLSRIVKKYVELLFEALTIEAGTPNWALAQLRQLEGRAFGVGLRTRGRARGRSSPVAARPRARRRRASSAAARKRD